MFPFYCPEGSLRSMHFINAAESDGRPATRRMASQKGCLLKRSRLPLLGARPDFRLGPEGCPGKPKGLCVGHSLEHRSSHRPF
jgi:hypothetical protein